MKKSRKILFVIATALIILSSVCLMTACGKSKKVSVDFNTNGGSVVATVSVKKGEEITLATPTKEGFEFAGWYLTENFSGEKLGATYKVTGKTTIYAKWDKLYTVTLNADGGTLTEKSIKLKKGANVYEAVKNLKPTKAGLEFGAWFYGNAELDSKKVMPENDIEVKAKYKVGYTIEIYAQKEDLTGYEIAETVNGSDYVGESFTAEYNLKGYEIVDKEDTVDYIDELSTTAGENVCKLYYDRKELTVIFNVNYPNGESEVRQVKAKYGAEISIINDLEFKASYLAGWSTTEGGKIEYATNYLDGVLFGSTKTAVADNITVTDTMVLYSVWNVGYTDMFGSEDVIYKDFDDNEIVYLCRGGVFFVGEYYEDENGFEVKTKDRKEVVDGKFHGESNYLYYRKDVANMTFHAYTVKDGKSENKYLNFDGYDGITYNVKDEEGHITQSKGTYYVDENNFYIATFTEGELNGQTLTIVVNQTSNVFIARNDEYKDKVYVRMGITPDNQLGTMTEGYYSIKIDGFYTATLSVGTAHQNYYYYLDEATKVMSLYSTENNKLVLSTICRLTNVGGLDAYSIYEEKYDNTFTTDGGASLKLDGMLTATYTNGKDTIKGYYSATESQFGGFIVNIKNSDGEARTFIVTSEIVEEAVEATDDQEGKDAVYKYEITEKISGYAEYLYKDEKTTYYAPLLVLNEPEKGKATIYSLTLVYNEEEEKTERKFEKAIIGTYTEQDGYIFFTAEEHLEISKDTITAQVDYKQLDEFVCVTTTATSGTVTHNVNYWVSATLNGEEEKYSTTYVDDKNNELLVCAGYGIFTGKDNDGKDVRLTGTITVNDKTNIATFVTSSGTSYIELNDDEKTFVSLKHAPYTAHLYDENAKQRTDEYVKYDGKDGAIYVIETGEGEEKVTTEYKGTIETTEKKSLTEAIVYKFVSENEGEFASFEYIMLQSSAGRFIAKFNAEINGEYKGEGEEKVELDGFSFKANYTDKEGVESEVSYYIYKEGVVCLLLKEVRYIDVKDGTFTMRGIEYGTYVIEENNYIKDDETYELDGYGNLKVTTKDGFEVEGTYTVDGESVTLEYIHGVKFIYKLGTFKGEEGTVKTITVTEEKFAGTYVNKLDYSVIKFNNSGDATVYLKNGNVVGGKYTIITDTLVYFAYDDDSDAWLYMLDNETGLLTKTDYTERAYYSQDFDSLLFSKRGFAVFGGTTKYYYEKDSKNNIIIYNYVGKGEEGANVYGFVADTSFGKFEQTKTYGGKDYIENSGYSITFNRDKEIAKSEYQLKLGEVAYDLLAISFAPAGTADYTINGSVILGSDVKVVDDQGVEKTEYKETTQTASIAREYDEEAGTYRMYANVSTTAGIYSFEFTVNYLGEDELGESLSTCEVVGLEKDLHTFSYMYLDTNYQTYMRTGAQIGNTYGVIDFFEVFDKDGEVTRRYLMGKFLEDTKALDSNGEMIEFEGVEYTEDENYKKAVIEGKDGYTYTLYLTTRAHTAYAGNTMGYVVVAFTRIETVNGADDYIADLGVIVYSEITTATVFSIKFTKGEQDIDLENIYEHEGKLYLIDVENKMYILTLEEAQEGIEKYSSFTVETKTAKTYEGRDGKSKLVVDENNKVVIAIYYNRVTQATTYYYPTDSDYDEKTKTYTATVEDATITITVVEEEVDSETVEKVDMTVENKD